MKLTKIEFNIYSKRNPNKYPHVIYADGHLTMTEITERQRDYVDGRNTGGLLGLKYTSTKVTYFESVEMSYPVS